MSGTSTVTEVILHCQKQIKKNPSEEKLLHYLARLRRLRIELKHLEHTGIGKTVNQLGRLDGRVGQEALDLVSEWKALVEAENPTSEESSSHEDEDDEEEEEEEEDDEGGLHIIDHQDDNGNEEDSEAEAEINGDEVDHGMPYSNSRSMSPPPLVDSNSKRLKSNHESDDLYAEPKYRAKSHSDYSTASSEMSSHSSKDRYKKERGHKKSEWDEDSGFEASQEVKPPSSLKIKVELPSSDEDEESHVRHAEKNGTLDPNVKVKTEPRTENKKSEKHRDKDNRDKESSSKHRDKDRDKRKHESNSKSHSKKPKDEEKKHRRSHEHNGSSSSSKHGHKDETHSSKRKREEEVLKSEVDIKKVKLEPKVEKQTDSRPRHLLPTLSREIDSTSGLGFADVLSCLSQTNSSTSSKKKDKSKQNGSSTSKSSTSKPSSSSSTAEVSSSSSKSKRTAHEDKHKASHSHSSGNSSKDAHKKHVKTESVIMPTNSSSTLISPNYKPSAVARIMAVATVPKPVSLPPREILNSLRQDLNGTAVGYPLHNGETRFEQDRRTNEDALSTMMSSRNQRTKVYSGVKSGAAAVIPRLFDLCIRVIQENINDLGFTGGVPYDILKPVLDRATATQLFHIENYNPYLIENTDELWKFHCNRDFRGKEPQELESWRELYTRCVDERKARFQSLTHKVRRKQETAKPQMKTKLAYVDTTSGPKFSRSKTETIKNGMKTLKTREEKGIKRAHGSSASAGGSGSSHNVAIEEASIIISADSKAGSAPAPSREREGYSAAKKPKKAPLMQKTMKIIKTLFRR